MSALAFYGDSEGAEVFAFDIDSMQLICRISTGEGPYPVDAVNRTHVLASTRKEVSVTPIEVSSLTPLPKVQLEHKPRSSSTNAQGLILVSGADQPLTSVIDSNTWTVTRVFGEKIQGSIEDFGGKLASGHERWLADGDRFFLIDRVRRRISLYSASSGNLLWTVNTPSSCHHVVPDLDGSGIFYAMCEGNPKARIAPSVMKLVPTGNTFDVAAHVSLPLAVGDIPQSGSHHVDVWAQFLYCGSNEGFTYVFRKADLSFVTRVVTGPGNGHTGFIEDAGQALGVTINHTAQFITIFDLITNTPLRSIQVSANASTGGKRTQGHTSGKRGRYFYMMASMDATLHEIDIISGVITRSFKVPPKDSTTPTPFPMQGVYIWDAPGAHCTQCC